MNNAIIATNLGIMEENVTNRIREKWESLEILECQIDCFYAPPKKITIHHPLGIQKEYIKS